MAAKQVPIQLVSFDKTTHSFNLTPEGESFLRSLDKPVAVLGIVGKQKTGKSFLADRIILDHKPSISGSGVSHTQRPGTKGVWVYPEVIESETDPDKRIIVLDSQGLGSPESDSTYDSRVFTICILMSSLLLYNSIGAIDEGALESIEFVGHLAKEIKLEDSKGKVCTNLFPSFFWLLRDFSLRLEDGQGKKISPQEYLENCLEVTKGISEANEKRNKTRRVIKFMFESRDCFTLVRPALTEFEVQRLDKLKMSEFRPEFLEQCKKLRAKLLKSVEVKEIARTAATGGILAEYLRSILEIVNSNRTLVLPSLHASVVSAFNSRLLADFKAGVHAVESGEQWLAVWKQSIGEDDEREKLRKELEAISAKEFERRRLEEIQTKKKDSNLSLLRLNSMPDQNREYPNQGEDIFDRGTFGHVPQVDRSEERLMPTFENGTNEPTFQRRGQDFETSHARSGSNPHIARFGAPQWISGPPSHIAGSLRGSVADPDLDNSMWKGENARDRSGLLLVMEEAIDREKAKMEIEHLKKRLEEKEKEHESHIRNAEKSAQTVHSLNTRVLELEIELSRQKLKSEEASKEIERLAEHNSEIKKRLESTKEELYSEREKEVKGPMITLSEHYSKLDEVRMQNHYKVSEAEKSILLKNQEIGFLRKDADNLRANVEELRADKKLLYEDICQLRSQLENSLNSKGLEADSAQVHKRSLKEVDLKLKEANNTIAELQTRNLLLEEEKQAAVGDLEEYRKNTEQLVFSCQQQSSINSKSQESQTTNFSALSQKYAALLEEVKLLKQMLDRSSGLICSACRSPFPVGSFPNHACAIQGQNHSMLDSSILTLHKQPQVSSRRAGLQVEILEVMVKENRENRRLYVEYKMRAKRGKKEWEVVRKYKEFCEFWTDIQKKYSVENFSPMVRDLYKLSRGPEGLPSSSMADRHKTLQEFLSEVSLAITLSNSEVVKEFLSEPPEEDHTRTFEEADDTMTEKACNSFMLKELDTPKLAGSPLDRKQSIPSGIKDSKSQVAVGLTKNKGGGSGVKIEPKLAQVATSSHRRVNLAKYLPKK